MRILVCDDDQYVIDQLEKYLVDFFKHNKLKIPSIKSYTSGEELLADHLEKDIVFLDVEMQGPSGIRVGRELKNTYPNIIIFIVTSYVEYLDDAMRFHVFRYLSKPLDKQRLFQNMKDAIQLYNTSSVKIPIETKDGVYTVLASDIISIEVQGRIITIHSLQGDYTSVQRFDYWKKTLTMPCFFQTHRSFIVNMKHVTNFDHSLVYLCDKQTTAYLTKRKYSSFKEAYFLYLESTR